MPQIGLAEALRSDALLACDPVVLKAADEIDRLNAWRKRAIVAAGAILAPITCEFGRVLIESPESDVVIQCEGCEVTMKAGKFTELYRATDT